MFGTSSEVQWITVGEAAGRLRLTERAVLKRIQVGKLDAERDGRRWYVRWESSIGAPTSEQSRTSEPQYERTAIPERQIGLANSNGQGPSGPDRLHLRDLELAGRIGYLERRIEELEARLMTLEQSRETQERSGARWWSRGRR